MEDFERFPTGAQFLSAAIQGWLQKIGLRQNIDLQQELTSVASGDELLIFDVSETGSVKTKKATVNNIGTTIAAAGLAGSFSTLTATGLVDISGASAGQIKFPATQNASSNANTLDDYEEGTWTPGIAFGAAATGVTYGIQAGAYVKIGASVFITGYMTLTSKGSSTGNAEISGLPFTVPNANANYATSSMYFAGCTLPASNYGMIAYTAINTTRAQLVSQGNTQSTNLTDTAFSNTSQVGPMFFAYSTV